MLKNLKAFFTYAVAKGRITTNPFGNKKIGHGNSEKTVAKIGINPITLSQSLNGNPTLSRLLEVANILDVEISELFTPKEKPLYGCLYVHGKPVLITSKEDVVKLIQGL